MHALVFAFARVGVGVWWWWLGGEVGGGGGHRQFRHEVAAVDAANGTVFAVAEAPADPLYTRHNEKCRPPPNPSPPSNSAFPPVRPLW